VAEKTLKYNKLTSGQAEKQRIKNDRKTQRRSKIKEREGATG
jgi:hypothetical protein